MAVKGPLKRLDWPFPDNINRRFFFSCFVWYTVEKKEIPEDSRDSFGIKLAILLEKESNGISPAESFDKGIQKILFANTPLDSFLLESWKKDSR